MTYRVGVYNEDGEPVGIETHYEPDPSDMMSVYDTFDLWPEDDDVCACGDHDWGACKKSTCMDEYVDGGGHYPESIEEYYGR